MEIFFQVPEAILPWTDGFEMHVTKDTCAHSSVSIDHDQRHIYISLLLFSVVSEPVFRRYYLTIVLSDNDTMIIQTLRIIPLVSASSLVSIQIGAVPTYVDHLDLSRPWWYSIFARYLL